MEPGGDSGGDSPLAARKRAVWDAMSRAAGWEMWATMGACNRLVVRAAREFWSGVAGAEQQDLALGNCIPPQSAMGRGRQHLSAIIAATGATQAIAGPASITTARASTQPLRIKCMGRNLPPPAGRGK